MPTYPAFHDGRPPQMTDPDTAPPDRSDYQVVGTLMIKGADMNRVLDPKYPWKEFASNGSPAYRKKAREIHASLIREVDFYLLTRRRYWERIERYEFPEDTEISITTHKGFTDHKTHTQDQSHSTTTRIAADLNLDLNPSGALPPEMPPVAAVARNVVAGDPNGGGSTTGLHFAHEVTDMLHITDTHDTTYTDEVTDTYRTTFKGGVIYLRWHLKDECIIQRQLKGESKPDDTPVSIVLAIETEQTQAFDPKTGDIS